MTRFAAEMRRRWSAIPPSHRTLLLVIVGTVTVFVTVFLKVADWVRESEVIVQLDQRVLDSITRHRTAWLSHVARAVTFVGDGRFVALVVVVSALAFLLRRRQADALFIVVSTSIAAIAVALVKHTVGRPRPELSERLVHATGAAFPSGHAAQSIACYGALAAIVVITVRSPPVRALAVAIGALLVFAIGASRVYLGVHWLSDVIGGWLLAGAWLLTLVGIRIALRSRPDTAEQP